ncbi:DNA/RNA nuclease SfsA [Desulfoluna limicola]|nr:DNA/RNA nuclease SfsA [Desulfoluna limicola]
MADVSGGVVNSSVDLPELYRGVLVKRYKRFLVDVRMEDGTLVTAHCNNTGSMKGCAEPGARVWLSYHDNPKRKHRYSWELVETKECLVGINTLLPNTLVARSIEAGAVPALAGYDSLRREVTVEKGTRLDMVLYKEGMPPCNVEVKNCTLVRDEVAAFPDAVTARGRKHLLALAALKEKGERSVIFFFIQRPDALRFTPADDIDPAYGKTLREVAALGVEIEAWRARVTETNVTLECALPVDL